MYRTFANRAWWRALIELEQALAEAEGSAEAKPASSAGASASSVERIYGDLVAALIEGGYPSLLVAAADTLASGEAVLASRQGEVPRGVRRAALLDLSHLTSLLAVDWHERSEAVARRKLPPMQELAPAVKLESWADALVEQEPGALLDALVVRYLAKGTGVFARYSAFRWRNGKLEGVARPTTDRLEELIGLDSQLGRLTDNVERFLSGSPAFDTLLYGPRGSGKSTAVRSLLTRYRERGLRLVEVARESLQQLPELGEELRNAPLRFVVFVDDLSFESGDPGYQPLKTLLEGSLDLRPDNVLLMATSNRRHLVRERMSERPMPEEDDVHVWDTTNERLALADRFGLVITFPTADQRDYLRVVRELAQARGIEATEARLDREAIRFADWGNGYSGRTARQFVDSLSGAGSTQRASASSKASTSSVASE